MGGRGRGGGGAGATVRAVANALGIARHEMAAYQQQPRNMQPPPAYPVLSRSLMPMDMDADRQYIADVKVEMFSRFKESEYHLDQKEKRDIRRYLDKYNQDQKETLKPDFSRIPDELSWHLSKSEKKARRKRGDDVTLDGIAEKLRKLEERETADGAKQDENNDDDEEEGSEKSEQVEGEALSEEDYAEEDNDYISAYFDNGEGYGDAGSDENMDGDE